MNRLINKTKIVATIGPASASKEVLMKMILEGVNVCRINFSHGSLEDHLKVIQLIREINNELRSHIAILADLQGPKLRIGEMEGGTVDLVDGTEIEFTTEKCIGTAQKVFLNYLEFPKDVSVGDRVLIDDGKLHLEVIKTNKKDSVVAKVIHGGKLSSKKGVNLPNTKISLPCLTEKDLKDLDFALKHNVAWIGLSFVRSPADIEELQGIINKRNKKAKVIAKIEKPEAIENIDRIIEISDALMVARGDLGVEVPMQDVPLLQKEIVSKCRKASKPVIIATQMMESMIENISPTRAEVNDVANAVMDGADAVMLSGETSVGRFPIDVIKAMYKIVIKVETSDRIYHKLFDHASTPERVISDSICKNSCVLAQSVDAHAIVTMTFSGYTAFRISSYRPNAHIFVFTSNFKILNMLNLIWGVRGFYYDKFVSTDHTIDDIKYYLRREGYVDEGELIINIASMPIANKGMSNMLKVSIAE